MRPKPENLPAVLVRMALAEVRSSLPAGVVASAHLDGLASESADVPAFLARLHRAALCARDVAASCGCSPRTVTAALRRGELPAMRRGRIAGWWFIHEADARAWAEARGCPWRRNVWLDKPGGNDA